MSAKMGRDPISYVAPRALRPSPENDELYRPVDPGDPEIRELAASIAEHGVREALVATADGFVLSGHRRRVAALVAAVERVPVRYVADRRLDGDGNVNPRFVVLLREYNRQRDKSLDEKIREELVTTKPEVAYRALVAHRAAQAEHDLEEIHLRARTKRARITKAKEPFLRAIERVLTDQRAFLPLSDRRIHYALLNHPPLRHASKPGSTYRNDRRSYKSLVELLTRARLAGRIPMGAITDATRSFKSRHSYGDPRRFVREELDVMFATYARDLQRSQPNHIEVVVEKNTVEPIVRPVALRCCVPITSGRGFCSLPPRAAMAQRFEKSGKSRLVMLFVTDFDPDGEEIAHSFARSMRDDFGIEAVSPAKVALTYEQVHAYDLPPNLEAKKSSSRYTRFVEKFGTNVYELEALPPATLQQIVQDAIDEVIDTEAFNAELDAEKRDAAYLADLRQRVHLALREAL